MSGLSSGLLITRLLHFLVLAALVACLVIQKIGLPHYIENGVTRPWFIAHISMAVLALGACILGCFFAKPRNLGVLNTIMAMDVAFLLGILTVTSYLVHSYYYPSLVTASYRIACSLVKQGAITDAEKIQMEQATALCATIPAAIGLGKIYQLFYMRNVNPG